MKKRRRPKTKTKAKAGCVRSGRRVMIDGKTLQNSKKRAD